MFDEPKRLLPSLCRHAVCYRWNVTWGSIILPQLSESYLQCLLKSVAKPYMCSGLEITNLHKWIQAKLYLFIACVPTLMWILVFLSESLGGSIPSAGSMTVHVQVWGFSLICRTRQGGVRPRLVQVDIVNLQTDVVLSFQTGQDVLYFCNQAIEAGSPLRLRVPTCQHDKITVKWISKWVSM